MGLDANLHNVVVFIKDEAMLEEAREILVANGETINPIVPWRITSDTEFNYLNLQNCENGMWFIGWSNYCDEITLTELEQLIKKEK